MKKGNTRIPLSIAWLYDEDLMTEDDLKKAEMEMEMEGVEFSKDKSVD